MSLLVEWNDKTYDVDMTEFSQRELDLIEQRTGLDWRRLSLAVLEMNSNALRALFWVIDQRTDQALKFSDYDGPPLRVWMPHMSAFKEIVRELGKAVGQAYGPVGSDGSPSTADTPQTSTTDSTSETG